jgi:hypothetical protein
LADRGLHRRLAVLDQSHDCGRRELLAVRGGLEHVARLDRDLQFDINQAIAFVQQDDAVLHDRNRGA